VQHGFRSEVLNSGPELMTSIHGHPTLTAVTGTGFTWCTTFRASVDSRFDPVTAARHERGPPSGVSAGHPCRCGAGQDLGDLEFGTSFRSGAHVEIGVGVKARAGPDRLAP